jgi:hypothetical protein
MILSEIKIGKQTKKSIITQRIDIKCDKCEVQYNSVLYNQISGFEKYNQDLCRSCKQKEQYKQGLRKDQSKKAGEGAKKKMKGKTFEEIHGKDKSDKIKKKISEKLSGEKNPNFGGKYSHGWADWPSQKGKTIEELWGEATGKRLRKHYSDTRKGKNNNMYGKPSPPGSGNGWSGWYKGWHFRSLLELSYVINVLERFNFSWESAERKKFRISYIDWDGTLRNYFPDFIIENKYLVEVKPKNLYESAQVKLKTAAGEQFCKNNNLIYKLTTPIKTLTIKDIKILKDSGNLKFTKRYEEKYNKLITV